MADKHQLQYLVRLLDDDSPGVRKAVVAAFEEYGSSLEALLTSQGVALNREDAKPIQHLLDRGRRRVFRRSWPEWFRITGDKQRLEAALRMIVEYQDGETAAGRMPLLLDRVAEEFSRREGGSALDLAKFLFKEKGIRGVGQSDYLNPLNSNLLYAIEQKKGLPITLTCVLILVADRLDLTVEGCNFPGHFLAIVPALSGKVLVDCYNGGRTIDETDLAGIDSRISMKDILRLECRSREIVFRVFRNLKGAYENGGDHRSAKMISSALDSMKMKISSSPL